MKKLRRILNRGPLACMVALCMAALAIGPGVYGCAALTGPEKAALSEAAPAIEAIDAAACDATKLIPYAGTFISSLCPEEEAKVKAAIDKAIASGPALSPPDAGPVTMAPLYKATPNGRRVVAKVDARIATACQFHYDAAKLADAGAEGGAK